MEFAAWYNYDDGELLLTMKNFMIHGRFSYCATTFHINKACNSIAKSTVYYKIIYSEKQSAMITFIQWCKLHYMSCHNISYTETRRGSPVDRRPFSIKLHH